MAVLCHVGLRHSPRREGGMLNARIYGGVLNARIDGGVLNARIYGGVLNARIYIYIDVRATHTLARVSFTRLRDPVTLIVHGTGMRYIRNKRDTHTYTQATRT